MAEAGHTFLARLGKKRLRPGGKVATDWLIQEGKISKDSKILEVACNMGTTSIELAQRFGCQIVAVDLDEKALEKARENAEQAGVGEQVLFLKANAMKLPFEDESFDIVLNEAMLTMQHEKGKVKCVEEYYRVLKAGGVLLTHDVMLKEASEEVRKELSSSINVNVGPLTHGAWIQLTRGRAFKKVETLTGDITLMKLDGMIYDEGWGNTFKILKNGLKKENRKQFLTMYKTFKKNNEKLGYIAMASWK